MMVADVGMLDLVSIVKFACDADSRALVICAAVGGFGIWTNQPAVCDCKWNSRTACSVITVFGADVPEGRLLISWNIGFARQLPLGHALADPGPALGAPYSNCMWLRPDKPGRIVRKMAFGLICDCLIPNALSNWGVPTYTGPFHPRPDAVLFGEASTCSSWTTSWEP